MVKGNLSLDVGSNIQVNEVKYRVEGYILFEDSDSTSWVEYKITSKEESKVQWLSVDELNDEYALFTEEIYTEEFLEENIEVNGYNLVDSSSARVIDHKGNVDVNLGEKVFYKEYEDDSEDLLISIENWNGENEFSKGYYIDKDDIEKLDLGFSNLKDTSLSNEINSLDKVKENKLYIGILVAIVLTIVVLILAFKADNPDKKLSSLIGLSANFKYETSITSDLDKEMKADIYSTNLTIEEAAKSIINEIQGDIEDVQENEEDGAVAILTKDEMAIVYTGENSKIFIQVSLREYVYSSGNTLYGGTNVSNYYYRSYYYTRGYAEDQKRYKNLRNSFSNYSTSTFTQNNSNKYKTYSDSIRQSSINSRSSSGDGISSGK